MSFIFHVLRKDLAVLEKAAHSRDEFYDVFLHNKSDAAVIDRCEGVIEFFIVVLHFF